MLQIISIWYLWSNRHIKVHFRKMSDSRVYKMVNPKNCDLPNQFFVLEVSSVITKPRNYGKIIRAKITNSCSNLWFHSGRNQLIEIRLKQPNYVASILSRAIIFNFNSHHRAMSFSFIYFWNPRIYSSQIVNRM